MKTPPFFSADLPAGERSNSKQTSLRLPFHDSYECPVGQEIKLKLHWQYYEPTQMADTRPRCPVCIELHRAGK